LLTPGTCLPLANPCHLDELLLERNARGAIWLHFAVRPAGNRKKVLQISS